MEYITKEAAQKCLDDLSSDNLIGNENDTFISVAEAKDRIEELPTADVVPKSEAEKPMFENTKNILHHLKRQIHDKAVYPHNAGIDAYITLKAFDAILQNYSNGLK